MRAPCSDARRLEQRPEDRHLEVGRASAATGSCSRPARTGTSPRCALRRSPSTQALGHRQHVDRLEPLGQRRDEPVVDQDDPVHPAARCRTPRPRSAIACGVGVRGPVGDPGVGRLDRPGGGSGASRCRAGRRRARRPRGPRRARASRASRCSAHDVGVEPAGQPAVGGQRDHGHRRHLAPGEQRLVVRPRRGRGHLDRQRLHAVGVRAQGLDPGLGTAQPRGRDELHGLGDLLVFPANRIRRLMSCWVATEPPGYESLVGRQRRAPPPTEEPLLEPSTAFFSASTVSSERSPVSPIAFSTVPSARSDSTQLLVEARNLATGMSSR